MKKSTYTSCLLYACALLLLSACEKNEVVEVRDRNTVTDIVRDNFNLKYLAVALNRSGVEASLRESGPFTLLAPSDNAFSNAGYSSQAALMNMDRSEVSTLMQYHVLDGSYQLDKLPFRFNQELQSRAGKIYATRWINGQDTILTLNGSRVLSYNIEASNGYLHVIDQVLTPLTHDYLWDALAADNDLMLFNLAVKRSGLLETLDANSQFTVFAPNNAAMRTRGYADLFDVQEADPDDLRELVAYHITENVRFVYDYILTSGTDPSSTQTMLNGSPMTVKLTKSSGSTGYDGITVRGLSNSGDVQLAKENILTGNGVLHVLNGVLTK